ncbi:S8 family serine peptidase [Clostridium paridis]|uniref:S8 family serine peptidase n=1 Tax=Clostridium paridis TaxID=2803863 RepID=A0A937FDY4_9CLOT|nr:S8 family serine peptidase [Clostridium paridis]MBL4930527.1 S8 family serine peptidase [Clostridium paridis]
MLSSKTKLDFYLKKIISLNLYKKFRVIIKCKSFLKDIERKVVSYNGTHIGSFPELNLIFAEVNKRALERLSEFPQIEVIFLDEFCHLCGGLSTISANRVPSSTKYMLTGRGVSIGIIDSGVYPHEDLVVPSNRIAGFYDFINKYSYPYDDNGHGTMVAGIISGSGHCSRSSFRGIAPESSIYSYKAFDLTGKGYISNIFLSINSIISTNEITKTKLVCLPFEYLGNSAYILDLFSDAFKLLINNNIVPIVPSGSMKNDSLSITGIAMLKNCITVGGLDTTNEPKPYEYSSCGFSGNIQKPDLSAAAKNIVSLNTHKYYIPERNGVKIYAPKLNKSYETFSGTSCSCAYITGLCALIFENNPSLGFKDLVSILKLSCESIDYDKNLYGEGYVNLSKLF